MFAPMRLILALTLSLVASPALAAPANVIDVSLTREPAGTFRADVTVRSDETGWNKYADRWEVLTPDGTVLAVRELAHPHVDEQPFTRSQAGIAIPEGIKAVRVRARDSVEGWGGAEMMIPVPGR
jgi:hypothetical protein